MSKEIDWSKAKRGAPVPAVGKTRVTMYMDERIVEAFKAESARTGKGYQTLINEALAEHVGAREAPMTVDLVRKIVREELEQAL